MLLRCAGLTASAGLSCLNRGATPAFHLQKLKSFVLLHSSLLIYGATNNAELEKVSTSITGVENAGDSDSLVWYQENM